MEDRITDNKIVLVTRRTRLDELIARFNTVGQAKFYVEHLGADFSDYLNEHEQYRQAAAKAEQALRCLARVHVLDRSFLCNYIFGKDDAVVVLGQDGLVANTLKYLDEQPIVGVNPDPARWDGVLLPFIVEDLHKIIPEVFDRKRITKRVTIAKAQLNNGQKLLGVNDLFIGPKTHGSARYLISINGKSEQHSSSGIIVSTGLGSTGWLKSLIAGSVQMVTTMLGRDLKVQSKKAFTWDAPYLYYTVREPFPSKTSEATIVFGKINAKQPLLLVSQMPENGVIFSDGIESDYLEFNAGTKATITLAEKQGHLVV